MTRRLRKLTANRFCPYSPITGPGRCTTRASILVVYRDSQSVRVCATHLPRYTANGWRRP